jgi:hypothetical protein
MNAICEAVTDLTLFLYLPSNFMLKFMYVLIVPHRHFIAYFARPKFAQKPPYYRFLEGNM